MAKGSVTVLRRPLAAELASAGVGEHTNQKETHQHAEKAVGAPPLPADRRNNRGSVGAGDRFRQSRPRRPERQQRERGQRDLPRTTSWFEVARTPRTSSCRPCPSFSTRLQAVTPSVSPHQMRSRSTTAAQASTAKRARHSLPRVDPHLQRRERHQRVQEVHACRVAVSDLAERRPGHDSAGVIPVADTVTARQYRHGKIKLQFKATGNAPSDTFTVTTTASRARTGSSTWGHDNPFNDVLVEEPSYGSSNGVLEFEGTGSASVVGHSDNTVNPSSETQVPNVPVLPARHRPFVTGTEPVRRPRGDFAGPELRRLRRGRGELLLLDEVQRPPPPRHEVPQLQSAPRTSRRRCSSRSGTRPTAAARPA